MRGASAGSAASVRGRSDVAGDGPAPSAGRGVGAFLRSETGVRLLSALVLVVGALGTTIAGGVPHAVFWLGVACLAAVEWVGVTRIERGGVLRGLLIAAAFGAVLLPLIGASPLAGLALAALALAAVLVAARRGADRRWGVTGLFVVGVLALVPVLTREHPALGLVGILWIYAVVWGTDVAAYFTGRALRGPKLWPRVSPGKTWSGFFGGLLAGTLIATVVVLVAERFGWTAPFGLPALVALAALASVLGQIGDLAESALKRRFHVKDSGQLIPGHGGVLDRVDAFFAVCCLVGLYLLADALGAIG